VKSIYQKEFGIKENWVSLFN